MVMRFALGDSDLGTGEAQRELWCASLGGGKGEIGLQKKLLASSCFASELILMVLGTRGSKSVCWFITPT